MKITLVIVNTEDSEYEYDLDRPSWDFSKVMAEMIGKHKDMTSMVITLVVD